MEANALPRRLYDLWRIEPTEREKAIKLLSKIFHKIISNPSEPKYGDLNFHKIRTKFDKSRPAFYLLYIAGFKQSIDGQRLQWKYNNNNINLLNKVNEGLKQKPKILTQPIETTKVTQNNYQRKIQKQNEKERKELIKQKIAESRKKQKIKSKQMVQQKEIQRQELKKYNEKMQQQKKKNQEHERKLQESRRKFEERKKQQQIENNGNNTINIIDINNGTERRCRWNIGKGIEEKDEKITNIGYIGDHILKYLKDIDGKDKNLVIGYIREHAYIDHKLHIPSSIINYCIIYLFSRIEELTVEDIEDPELLVQDRFTVYKVTSNDGKSIWKNVFGLRTIYSNTGIHEWTLKISSESGFAPFVVIGIVPTKNIKNERYMNREIVRGWIIDDCLNGYGLQIGCGIFFDNGYNDNDFNAGGICYMRPPQFTDVIKEHIFKMIYYTNNHTIKYEMDDNKLGVAMLDVPKQQYKLGVSILDKCKIELIYYQQFPFNNDK